MTFLTDIDEQIDIEYEKTLRDLLPILHRVVARNEALPEAKETAKQLIKDINARN